MNADFRFQDTICPRKVASQENGKIRELLSHRQADRCCYFKSFLCKGLFGNRVYLFYFYPKKKKKKDPYRVERLRWDALAWMLNAADLRHGSKVWKMCVFSLFRSKRDLKALGD